jgi:hypothetical protein
MQALQLFIEGQRVDLFKDESVTITQSIQNVKDIEKVFTDYTKTFNVPASPTNNKIFKHYYNFNIQDGFDARTKKDALLELNNLPFKSGKIKLEGVDLKDNKAHTYRITFFGSTVALKDVLGEDKIQGLDLSAFDTEYTSTAVESKFSADPSLPDTHLVVPLITHTRRLFYDSDSGHNHGGELDGNLYYQSGGGHNHGVLWSDLKYALRIHEIIKAIEVKYPELKFSDDFFNDTNEHYYNLFMWLHRKKGDVENLSGINESVVNGWIAAIGDYNDTLTKMVNTFTLGVIGEPSNYGLCELSLDTVSTDNYSVSIQKDGVEVYNTGTINGNQVIDVNNFGLEVGEYTVLIGSEFNIVFSNVEWNINYLSFNDVYGTGSYNYTSTFEFIISQQIPEMKIIDFLTGLFKMFNLTAFVDDNTKEIIVKTLDEFYNDGDSFDITQYIDVSKSSVDTSLPYKEINFEYEDTDTFLASVHNQLFGKEWGKENYEGGEKLDGGIYSVKAPFSHLKYEKLVDSFNNNNTTIQWGYFVDDNESSYYGKPLLFYPILNSGTELSFLTSETNNSPKTNYVIPSNSVALASTTSKKNINFFAENNEYDRKGLFTDTLFNVFYRKYIEDVFDGRNRLTKVTAYLPLKILRNYTLADRFIINGNSYKINSINTNLETGKSDLELLNDL